MAQTAGKEEKRSGELRENKRKTDKIKRNETKRMPGE
jgi:hypothetical protein